VKIDSYCDIGGTAVIPVVRIVLVASSVLCLQEVHNVLAKFERYHHVWKLEREDLLDDLLARSPTVDEFEQNILSYKALIEQINSEPQYLVVGSIALFTGEVDLVKAL